MIIREETPADYEAITNVTRSAFENHPYSNQTEPLIITTLREADVLSVSLVADDRGEIVGHIAFSPVTFSDGSEQWYGLGPVSVLPACQRQGIGTKLINEGIILLKDMYAEGCVLVGDPDYYYRFGFTSPQALKHEGVPQENFLALPFADKIPAGTVKFHQAFAV